MHCNKGWPPLTTTRESSHAATKTQHSQSINQSIKQKNKNLAFSPMAAVSATLAACSPAQCLCFISLRYVHCAPYFFLPCAVTAMWCPLCVQLSHSVRHGLGPSRLGKYPLRARTGKWSDQARGARSACPEANMRVHLLHVPRAEVQGSPGQLWHWETTPSQLISCSGSDGVRTLGQSAPISPSSSLPLVATHLVLHIQIPHFIIVIFAFNYQLSFTET